MASTSTLLTAADCAFMATEDCWSNAPSSSWDAGAWLRAIDAPVIARAPEPWPVEPDPALIDVVRAVRRTSELWRLGPINARDLLPVTSVTHALDAVGLTAGSPSIGAPTLLRLAMTQAARAKAYRDRKAGRQLPVTSVTAPMTPAERASAYRQRRKAKAGAP